MAWGTVTLYAILRRFGIAAGSGIFACFLAGWPEWLRGAIVVDKKTAIWWPLLWGLVELIQKAVREQKKAG